MNDSTHVRPLILVIDDEAIFAYLSALIQENANTIEASHLVASPAVGTHAFLSHAARPTQVKPVVNAPAPHTTALNFCYTPICRYVREPIME